MSTFCQSTEWFSYNKGLFASRFVSYESIQRKKGRGKKDMKLTIFLGSSLLPVSLSDFLGSEIRGRGKGKVHL